MAGSGDERGADVGQAFLAVYEDLRRFLAGYLSEDHLRVTLQRHEALWRRLRKEAPKRGKSAVRL